ncbi:hypothetical protein [Kosakonia phage Kc304]|uniref:Uncharacterized protein n=2 Tax=Winklervirus chi14 TaxID=2560752 RepID=A0A1Z1LYL0_9CAUD|nr:hypothetical protein FDI23_gp203 [Serratia phage CHI14]ARW57635.1 hypothetical protein [Serratia phage CHI14]ARW57910.1 hypothetical protein [Serratia phage CBH8]QYN80656.1 hypothetical protein [Kosakonia phage Kc304]
MTTINLKATVKCHDHDGYKAQTVNELQWMVSKFQSDVVHCMTPEGPSDDFSYYITVENFFTGEIYKLNSTVYGHIRSETYEDEDDYSEDVTWYENARTRADNLIEKIKAKGIIDLANWTRIK